MKHAFSNKTPNIFISVGEASGDLLAAPLVQAILAKNPQATIHGMGGKQMQAAGVNIIVDADGMAVVGFIEIIKHLRVIRSAYKTITKFLAHTRPDLVILVDYPGFNLRLAKCAKKLGCKVLYYVSPQIWAWNYRRINRIKKYVDHIAVLFQFEETLYKNAQVPATFVGHPLVDIVKPSLTKEMIYQQFGLSAQRPIIALLPGSRRNEISRILPIIMQSVSLIRAKIPDAQFVLPLAQSIKYEDIAPYLIPGIQVIENQNYNLFSIADAAIATSGTVILELTLQKVPMVIVYAASPITAWCVKRVIHVKYLGLCNLIADKMIAKELLQENAKPEWIAAEILQLLHNPTHRKQIIQEFEDVISKLGEGNGSEKVATVAMELLSNET